MKRQCGDCQLCCKLLPMQDNEPWRGGAAIDKPAGVRCPHQKHGKGCAIYAKRPFCCRMWTCRWLANDDAADLSRPDRVFYVIDVMPDYVTVNFNDESRNIQVVQIWVDPKHPDAHRDPALRDYMIRRAQDGIAAIVRYDSQKAIVIFAPPFDAKDGEWHEITSGMTSVNTHTYTEIVQALGGDAKVVIEQ